MNPFLWLTQHPRISWTLVLLYMGIIFILSHQPDIESPFTAYTPNVVEHLVEYFVLGILLLPAFYGSGEKRIVLAVSVGLVYGVIDEIHQFFIPGRVMSLLDIIADGVGSLIGVYFSRFFLE
jgi:VanZ family protein